MDYRDILTLGIAFGLGLLVGLQRQTSGSKMAGVRTFTLITIFGVVSGFLARDFGNHFIIPFLGLALTALLVTANILKVRMEQDEEVGQTTEVAALLMFAIGAYLVMGEQVIAVVMGGSVAVLLYLKDHLHNFIKGLEEKDMSAIMTFAGISLIILPILPNETFGPLNVLNPRNIWLMITLIVGISVIGYFIYKFLGKRTGILSNGILGGLISSTATTVSYARKTANNGNIEKLAAFVITAASAISLLRVLIEVGVIIPEKLAAIIVPILIEFVFMAIICGILYYAIRKEDSENQMPEPKNPAQFKSALVFGLLYGIILLAVAFAKKELGNSALYIVSILSGLTDVDAITLSLSNLMKDDRLEAAMGWKLILLAALSNLVFKGVMAAVLGTRKLAKLIGISFGMSVAAGLLLIWLWPETWHL